MELSSKAKLLVAMIEAKNIFDLNPNSHEGHLTLFWPPDFQDEPFPNLAWR